MKYGLQIKPEQCSRLGQEILKYIEENQLSMSEMARRVGITQPGLRECCWHRAMPTEATLRKLANLMGKPPEQLLKWIYEDKIKYGYEAGVAEALLQAIEDAIKVIRILVNDYPPEERPSDYEIIEQALNQTLKVFKPFGLKTKELAKQ
ncbi:helix-turn-helix domain-containing protein [Aerosakkonemataceae cyanobacterium BLCC-F154]|uniref:Helix-turn-helix domain-containing protein n=1 Tax=Floridaenema fluviatile BLCC-F154 TaxID=3153640 RepID=A0ABV4YD99_9CYAN